MRKIFSKNESARNFYKLLQYLNLFPWVVLCINSFTIYYRSISKIEIYAIFLGVEKIMRALIRYCCSCLIGLNRCSNSWAFSLTIVKLLLKFRALYWLLSRAWSMWMNWRWSRQNFVEFTLIPIDFISKSWLSVSIISLDFIASTISWA